MLPPSLNLKFIAAGVGLAVLAAVLFYIGALDRHLQAEKTSHAETKVGVATGQVEAQVQQQQRNQVTKSKQEMINEEALASYRRRIAELERANQRLRDEAGSPPTEGSPSRADLPGLPAPAFGIAEASECTADRIQLDELISWVYRQHSVDPNAPL